jgi:tetratricopeptide (TPR) repeat protein
VFARKKPWRQALLWQLPSALIAVGSSALVLTIWHDHAMVRGTLGGPELAPLRVSQTLGAQLLTALWPSRTAPMYASQTLLSVQLGRSLACVVYLLACIWAYRRRLGLVFTGLLGFAIWLAPAANAVPLYFPLQDRYASLPVFSLSLALAGVLAVAKPPSRSQLQGLAAVACVALGLRTWQYAGEWQSEPRLWGHAVSTQPDAEYAYLKLGEARREAGDLDGAISAYQGAIHVAPGRKLAHADLFEVVARRDERWNGAPTGQARSLAQHYYAILDKPMALREFTSQLWPLHYVRAIELPLQALQFYQPLPENALGQAALNAYTSGRPTIARFYLHALNHAPTQGPLALLYEEPYFRVVP